MIIAWQREAPRPPLWQARPLHQHHHSEDRPPTLALHEKFTAKLSSSMIIFIVLTLNILAVITTTAINADPAHRFGPDQKKTTWLHRSITGRIDDLYVDEKNTALYVLSVHDILKYTTDLVLRQTVVGNRSEAGSTQNRIVSIIFTAINHNGLNLLLSCNTASTYKHLVCQLYRMDNLKGKHISWSYKGEDGQSIKLDIQTGNDECMRILSSSNGRDMLLAMGRPTVPASQALSIINNTSKVDTNQELYMPTLARFSLITKNSSSLQISSVLPYRSQVGQSNDYIYMFQHGDHTHFVLNDISKTENSVRLARICKDDTELYSYTEISITCEGKTDVMAKTATLTDSGLNDRDLYVLFEDRNQSLTSSYICKYSLSLINAKIDAAISQCHKASHATKTLAKLYPASTPLDCKLNNLSNDWCTSKINIYIDGTADLFSVSEEKFVELKGMSSINFLHVSGQEDKTIYFIGTRTGLFSKFNPAQDDILYTVDLFSKKVKYSLMADKSSNVADTMESGREAKYAVVSRDIIAATSDNELHRLPMDSCRFYTTCSVCIRVNEPDLCVWCHGLCSRDKECSNATEIYRSSCPPYIERFEPTAGPLSGQTKLSIFGQSFGSRRASLQVKLDDRDCQVDKRVTDENKVVCEVEPVDGPKNATIYVTVYDNTGPHDINGTSRLENIHYEYKEVIMFGIYPGEGPLSGANVTVFGNNLDVGSNRTIHFGEVACQITSTSDHTILCRIEAMKNQGQVSVKNAMLPRLEVDGQAQKFLYTKMVDGVELSQSFSFVEDAILTSEALTRTSVGFYSVLLIFIIIIITFAILIFVLRYNGFSVLKVKLPGTLSSRLPESDNTKVIFRNPHSHAFNNANLDTRQSDSLNGLIRLNGSVMSSDYFGKPDQLEQDKPLMQNFLNDETLTLLAKEKVLIDRNKLTLGHVLGSGQFGRVYKGFLKVDETGEHAAVAVKTLHSRCHWEDGTDNQAFLEEGLMMKDFNHDNVLALIGVAFDSNGLPMVITPFMLYGDLRSYISDEASSPTVKELIEFGTQVAQGMAYLSNQKFVHRDLAARNCMLDENLVVKVADFGLSRDIYERDYYSSDNKTVKLPVKWMAIESLEKSVYTTKSDVWSYGVLLWELMTRGVVPYPDVDNFDLYQYLKGGRRMLRPKYCPVILYNLMLSCWNENPALRPTFDELVPLVSNVITKLREAKDESGQQKVDKDETYCDVIR